MDPSNGDETTLEEGLQRLLKGELNTEELFIEMGGKNQVSAPKIKMTPPAPAPAPETDGNEAQSSETTNQTPKKSGTSYRASSAILLQRGKSSIEAFRTGIKEKVTKKNKTNSPEAKSLETTTESATSSSPPTSNISLDASTSPETTERDENLESRRKFRTISQRGTLWIKKATSSIPPPPNPIDWVQELYVNKQQEEIAISDPSCFRQQTHIGYNPDTGEWEGMPPEWKTLLDTSGLEQSVIESDYATLVKVIEFQTTNICSPAASSTSQIGGMEMNVDYQPPDTNPPTSQNIPNHNVNSHKPTLSTSKRAPPAHALPILPAQPVHPRPPLNSSNPNLNHNPSPNHNLNHNPPNSAPTRKPNNNFNNHKPVHGNPHHNNGPNLNLQSNPHPSRQLNPPNRTRALPQPKIPNAGPSPTRTAQPRQPRTLR
eukprot:TRINITY_DN4784_c0_g1_i1.p1 TRINITY_DN4784_c0_g1~~TRINITY_DN4784_c0_g1_i1.p1  ORF type:complete len:430 (+),score=91.28 TRINITY_DN4784_c0_g1_i1:40-1329(+)